MTQNEIDQICENIKKADYSKQMLDLLKASTANILVRAKENLDAQLQEDASAVVQRFESSVGERLVNMSTEWIDSQSKELIVFPDGTRFVQRSDNALNILVEQKPQQRRILFNDQSFFLSLPYVQFSMNFVKHGKNDRFQSLQVSCSKTPIRTLNDTVYPLMLPNISTFNVCTGYQGSGMQMPEGKDSVMEKIDTLITSYWASQFNWDLSNNLMAFMQANFSLPTSFNNHGEMTRLVNEAFKSWQEKSLAEPLWMIGDTAKFMDRSGVPVGRMIPNDLASRGGRQAFRNQFKTQVNNGLGEISQSIIGALRQFDVTTENRENAHISLLQQSFRSVVAHAYQALQPAIFRDLQEEKGKFERSSVVKEQELGARERTLVNNESRFTRDKTLWDQQKLKTQTELYALHQLLQGKAQEFASLQQQVQTLQAQLESRAQQATIVSVPVPVGPDGVPVKRGRGRPRKVVVVPLDADGNPIRRKRGRPRKNPAA